MKIEKKLPKTTLQPDSSCSMQKTVSKNNEYSKDEAIFKIDKNGQYAKAIALQNYNLEWKTKIEKKSVKNDSSIQL